MTEEQDKLLTDFQVRLKQLMLFCDKLKSENKKLQEQLLTKEEEILSLQDDLTELNKKYENQQTAQALASHDNQGAEKAKARLVKLVRDVDKCIAMLKN
ncbi:MAG: hypothetical protein QM654_16800 [Dysgonamonadaceae bacterium]